MKDLTIIFKALADGNRLRIINMLLAKPLCVCELTEVLGLATSTVSKHLSILRQAELITDAKDGKWVDYKVNTQSTPQIYGIIEYIKAHTNSEQFIEDRKRIGSVDRYTICNIKM